MIDFIFSFIIIIYAAIVMGVARRISQDIEHSLEGKLCKEIQDYDELSKKKDFFYQEKMGLEAESLSIFTLYEMTKEITKCFNEKDAFDFFKQKLSETISFESCQLWEPLSEKVKEFNGAEQFIFNLQGKSERIGILAIDGIKLVDKEKAAILSHQFALALRRVKLYEEIEKIAITDSLTGVYTRRYFLDRFQEDLKRSKIRDIKLSILMVDVDFFKKFNDQYGHLTGDQILRAIGTIIKENIREIDIAGRYGGEEFCVVLPDTDSEGAKFAAERIRKATEGTTIKAYDATINSTVSIGIATFPTDGQSQDELIDKADWALYRAKKLGRNRVCVFGLYKD